ncbi:MAG: histidine kinase [Rhodoferax sp.]|nr:histidine kinase [Rhodoferax sp.]
MKYRWRDLVLLGAPGLVLAALVAMLALESYGGERLFNAALGGFGLILVWSVAVAVKVRYPQRPLGSLLFLLAVSAGVASLSASRNPLLFTAARIAKPTSELLLLWIMLAYPSGRLSGALERRLVIAAAISVLGLWLPSASLNSNPALGGPFMPCQIDCPRNLLLVSEQLELSRYLTTAFRYVAATLLAASVAIMINRLRNATPLMRRVLAPVVLASIVRMLVVATFLLNDSSRLALTLSFWAVPLSMAIGLLRGRLYAARVLQFLVSGMRGQSDAHSLRAVMATALDDNSLEIAYWIKDQGRWVDDLGQSVSLSYPSVSQGRRAVTVIQNAKGGPVAALIHDAALLEEPALVESVAGSLQTVLEFQRLAAEVKLSRSQTVSAVETERRRIERDLHDGAQQRLIALRIKLSVTDRILEQDPSRAALLIHELGTDVDAAIKELREFAHGVVPPLLAERGLSQALIEVAQRAALPIVIGVEEVGRCAPAVESAVYYCCLEALQNSAKYADPAATVTLKLGVAENRLVFEITNDLMSDAATQRHSLDGCGVTNMRERIKAVGGRLDAGAQSGSGYAVKGSVPIAQT